MPVPTPVDRTRLTRERYEALRRAIDTGRPIVHLVDPDGRDRPGGATRAAVRAAFGDPPTATYRDGGETDRVDHARWVQQALASLSPSLAQIAVLVGLERLILLHASRGLPGIVATELIALRRYTTVIVLLAEGWPRARLASPVRTRSTLGTAAAAALRIAAVIDEADAGQVIGDWRPHDEVARPAVRRFLDLASRIEDVTPLRSAEAWLAAILRRLPIDDPSNAAVEGWTIAGRLADLNLLDDNPR